jgi:hypothetical protein
MRPIQVWLGADLWQKNFLGQTPIDVAEK